MQAMEAAGAAPAATAAVPAAAAAVPAATAATPAVTAAPLVAPAASTAAVRAVPAPAPAAAAPAATTLGPSLGTLATDRETAVAVGAGPSFINSSPPSRVSLVRVHSDQNVRCHMQPCFIDPEARVVSVSGRLCKLVS